MGSNRRYPRDAPPDLLRRHCWVLRAGDRRGPFPGLILEWKHLGGDRWSARVVYITDHRRASSVEEWLAREHLRPVDSWPSEKVLKEVG